jgi:hypothetical protein
MAGNGYGRIMSWPMKKWTGFTGLTTMGKTNLKNRANPIHSLFSLHPGG